MQTSRKLLLLAILVLQLRLGVYFYRAKRAPSADAAAADPPPVHAASSAVVSAPLRAQTLSIEVLGCLIHCVERAPTPARADLPEAVFLHGAQYSSADWVTLGTLDRLARRARPRNSR